MLSNLQYHLLGLILSKITLEVKKNSVIHQFSAITGMSATLITSTTRAIQNNVAQNIYDISQNSNDLLI